VNKCKNCEWHNKPFWSIINHCDSCTKEDIPNINFNIFPKKNANDKEVLEYLRTHTLFLGDFIITYNGTKLDTVSGKTESWTITRKLPFFEGGKEDEQN
jgi:hypothetical protein